VPRPGETLRLRCRRRAHPQYGRQFLVEDYTAVLSATVQGVRRYLGSGLIKRLGPRAGRADHGHFSTDALRVMEKQAGRLVEVPNLGPTRTRLITEAWEQQKAIKKVMMRPKTWTQPSTPWASRSVPSGVWMLAWPLRSTATVRA